MSNREYISDTQRIYDKSKYNKRPVSSTGETVNNPGNTKTSASGHLSFCPECGSMMSLQNGEYECRCGYPSNPPKANKDSGRKKNSIHNSKIRTSINYHLKTHKYSINAEIPISGKLLDKHNNGLSSDISVYIDGKFVKSIKTNVYGYFDDYITINNVGVYEITLKFEGNYKHQKSTVKKYIKVEKFSSSNKSSLDNESITNLERLGALYKQGILTREQFEEAKRKVLLKWE